MVDENDFVVMSTGEWWVQFVQEMCSTSGINGNCGTGENEVMGMGLGKKTCQYTDHTEAKNFRRCSRIRSTRICTKVYEILISCVATLKFCFEIVI